MKSVALYQRMTLKRTLLVCLGFAVFFLFIAYLGLSDAGAQGKIPVGEPEHTKYILNYYASFLPVILLPMILVFTPAWGYLNYFRSFRKSPFFNKEVTYEINSEGLSFGSGSFYQKSDWTIIGKVREGRSGFLIFYGKSARQFHWIPKWAFSVSNDAENVRKLFRENIKDFLRL